MDIIKTDITADNDWNEFLRTNYNMFYDYKFISYNDVFRKGIDWHHLKFKEKNRVLAILNGCEKEQEDGKYFISCNGVSFGGFIWRDRLKISDYIQGISDFKEYLKSMGFKGCIIRNPPCIYSSQPNEEYEYSLLISGFEVLKNSITNIIDLNQFVFEKLANPKKRSIQKSEKHIKVGIIETPVSADSLKEYYNILYRNRELKNVKPTHSLEELVFLKNILNERIKMFYASVEEVIAGICILFFVKKDVVLNFYLAADEEHKKDRVSDYLLYRTIKWSKENKFRLYDIGTSNIGNTLLLGLFDFKKKFMADGFLRKSFIIKF